ncbi:alpha/beta hydrolase [Pyrococcus sp. ST04]|uniref:alpha/beta hydrolase n=1 Tax=Pyrococcus sp. ST04 TaxID=1183377 RepID=UPI00026058C0|nr:alpha/beta fold hydrolase [Pyrococcus sp. ST04]AFK21653.1 2-acetyl-1-alkylglycerophosph ocholine esterase [Pyrococcus sp. ST04]
MIIGIILGIVLILLIFSAIVGYKMVTPPRKKGTWTPKDLGFDYEDVEIKTRDGLKLRGWWVNRGSDKTIVLLHGYTSSRWDETYIKPALKFLAEAGYNVLLFDFRAHGESEGTKTTVGDKELIDLLSAIDWLENRGLRRIGVVGFSMGAIVTIRGLGEDERIACGVADSPPIYMEKTAARGVKYFANLPEFLYPLIKPFTIIFSGGKIVNVIEYAGKIRKPLLLIAGKKDPLVKPEEVEEFYRKNREINEKVQIWITDSPHVRTIVDTPEEWKKMVIEFLESSL